MSWLPLLFLAVLSAHSVRVRRELVTPTTAFSFLWIVGFAVVPLRDHGISAGAAVLPCVAGALLLLGELSVRLPGRPASGESRSVAAAAYWILTAVAFAGAWMKFTVSLAYIGDLRTMLTTTELRGAVTSSDLLFSPMATAFNSAMYVAAALAGYLCQDRFRARYLTHFAGAILDSAALAGRGSFIIASVITLVGLGIAWRGTLRAGVLRFGTAAGATLAAVLALTIGIGRRDAVEKLWEYLVGPLFGLSEYLVQRPPTGISGPSIVNALSAKLGGERYDPGSFVFYQPFVGNVHSGFKELLSDFGLPGLLFLVPVAFAATAMHVRFRERGGWASYIVSVSLYSLLAYFYYVPLSAFLTAWWLILFSAAGAWFVDAVRDYLATRTVADGPDAAR